MEKKIAIVTGASSGIGRATALALHKSDFKIIACGRRLHELEYLKAFIPEKELLILTFDVSVRQEVRAALESVPDGWKEIALLVNNAGNAHGLDYFQDGNWEDWEKMVDINIKGLLAVTEAVLPFMLARKQGHIINLGSIAGLRAYPKGSVYCASKAAVDMFSECLRIDLNAEGIKVSEIKPGMVETDFSLVRFKGDEERAKAVYQNLTPLSADDVAQVIAFMATVPAHVNLADVTLLPLDQASATVFNRKPLV